MSLVPLPERSSINLDDSALDKRVRSDEFVVGRVVHLQKEKRGIRFQLIHPKITPMLSTHDTNDPRLAGNVLRAPGEVARVEAEGTVLGVTTAGADGVDALHAELGVGGLAAEFELALLAVVRALGAGCGALVPGGARDTYGSTLVE